MSRFLFWVSTIIPGLIAWHIAAYGNSLPFWWQMLAWVGFWIFLDIWREAEARYKAVYNKNS